MSPYSENTFLPQHSFSHGRKAVIQIGFWNKILFEHPLTLASLPLQNALLMSSICFVILSLIFVDKNCLLGIKEIIQSLRLLNLFRRFFTLRQGYSFVYYHFSPGCYPPEFNLLCISRAVCEWSHLLFPFRQNGNKYLVYSQKESTRRFPAYRE